MVYIFYKCHQNFKKIFVFVMFQTIKYNSYIIGLLRVAFKIPILIIYSDL